MTLSNLNKSMFSFCYKPLCSKYENIFNSEITEIIEIFTFEENNFY